MPLKSIPYFKTIKTDISIKKLISNEEFKCTDNKGAYDNCRKQEIIENLSQICFLPFIKLDSSSANVTPCSSFEEGQEALSIYQDTTSQCQNPCDQLQVSLHDNVEYYLDHINTFLGAKYNYFGYIINLPRLVSSAEIRENYGLISAIADIGGIAGLFLGFSVLGICSKLDGLYSNKQYNAALKVVKWIIILFSLVCISYIFYEQFNKLQKNERSSNIMLEDQYFNLSISVCSLKNVFLKSTMCNSTYVANTAEFWNNGRKLGNNIENLNFHFRDKRILNVFNKDLKINILGDLKHINRPKYEQFVEFCTTINLNQFEAIEKVELIAKKEITIYVHYNGQLLNLDSEKGTTAINPLTVYSFDNHYEISSSTTDVRAEYVKLSLVASDSYNESYSYDDCIIDNIASEIKELDAKQFLSPDQTVNYTKGLNETEFRRLNVEFHRVKTYCDIPTDTVKIKYFQEKNKEKTKYEAHKDVNCLNYSQKYNGKANISKFKKRSKQIVAIFL